MGVTAHPVVLADRCSSENQPKQRSPSDGLRRRLVVAAGRQHGESNYRRRYVDVVVAQAATVLHLSRWLQAQSGESEPEEVERQSDSTAAWER